MANIEKRVIKSFNLAKEDIFDLKGKVGIILDMQQKLEKRLSDLRKDEVRLYEMLHKINPLRKIASKPKKTKLPVKMHHHALYMAPKGGKKFHIRNCPFAQNIKPKNQIKFKSKTKALNKGFKPCKCIK